MGFLFKNNKEVDWSYESSWMLFNGNRHVFYRNLFIYY